MLDIQPSDIDIMYDIGKGNKPLDKGHVIIRPDGSTLWKSRKIFVNKINFRGTYALVNRKFDFLIHRKIEG